MKQDRAPARGRRRRSVTPEQSRAFYMKQYAGLAFAMTAFAHKFRKIEQVTAAARAAPVRAEWIRTAPCGSGTSILEHIRGAVIKPPLCRFTNHTNRS